MRTHRRTRRIATAVVAALSVALSGSPAALAIQADGLGVNYPRPVPEARGLTPSDFTKPLPKVGDTPSEFGQRIAPAPRVGDIPADFPRASRAPKQTPPTTIEIVRPERTIVRDTAPALPIALAGLALLLSLGLAGTALIRVRSLRLG